MAAGLGGGGVRRLCQRDSGQTWRVTAHGRQQLLKVDTVPLSIGPVSPSRNATPLAPSTSCELSVHAAEATLQLIPVIGAAPLMLRESALHARFMGDGAPRCRELCSLSLERDPSLTSSARPHHLGLFMLGVHTTCSDLAWRAGGNSPPANSYEVPAPVPVMRTGDAICLVRGMMAPPCTASPHSRGVPETACAIPGDSQNPSAVCTAVHDSR